MGKHNFRKKVKKFKDFKETAEGPVKKEGPTVYNKRKKSVNEWNDTGSKLKQAGET